MKLKKIAAPALRVLSLGTLLLIASIPAPSALAAGLACLQEGLAQLTCGDAKGDGFCECSFASLSWGEITTSTWCRASGKPEPACRRPAPADDRPEAQIEDAETMAGVLQDRNLYVATLVQALQQDRRWLNGPVEGLLQEGDRDPTTGEPSFGPALPFRGHVLQNGLGAVQFEIVVLGDLDLLVRLKEQDGSAVPPRLVQGTVTDGGLHGTLQVIGPDGRSETIKW